MKRCVLLIFLLALSLPLAAVNPLKISGLVIDSQTKEPVVGAVVRLDGNYLWAVTELDGKYALDKVLPGKYILSVSCLGYVDQKRELSIDKDLSSLDFSLSVNSLALDEVVVTAETSKDALNTTQKIGRNALDHLQMSGVSNIAALLPGGKTINPDLTKDNAISLRSGGATVGNAAFGTAIEVDGVRMGDNANFSGMGGTGTRGISVENIESVEVVTGVPSAEYGDLNSGMVRVSTKKGRSPVSVVFSVNPRTYQTSLSKGFDLGGKRGTLNLSAEWAKATAKLSSPYSSYSRRGFTVDYSNTFHKVLRLEAGLSGNIGGMNTKSDPDLFSHEYNKVRDNTLSPHFKAVWLLNKSWVTNFTLSGSIYYHDQRSQVHAYNSFSSSQPAVHSEKEGYYFADALPLTYYSDQITDSKELDYSASLKYDWLAHWGSVKSVLKAGVQWKADGNVGDGEYYKDPSLAANGYRPRPYKAYPYMHNVSYFIEDNLTIPVGRTSVDLGIGLRYESVYVKGTQYDDLGGLSPRLNLKWKFSDKVAVRGGWGLTSKLPSFYVLYPRQEYRDIQTFGYSYGSSGGSQYVYYTSPYTNRFNPDLKWQKNSNSELGIDLNIAGVKLSLAGYYNVTFDPYKFSSVYTPFSYNLMTLPEGFTVKEGTETILDRESGYVYFRDNAEELYKVSQLRSEDRTFLSSPMPDNGTKVVRTGLELTADFPEIRAIRTQFRLDAAYGHTYHVDDSETFYYNKGWSHTTLRNRSYQYVGIYAGGNSVSNGDRTAALDANLTAITHIPAARIIVTCRLEAALLRHSQNLSRYKGRDYAFTVGEGSNQPTGGRISDGKSFTAIYPLAYLDLDGVRHEWTQADASNPELANLIIRSGNAYIFAKDGYDPYFSANLSVTKEIGNHVSFSFFANNFTNSRKFVKSYATGVSAIFTPEFYYGLTCRVKF